MPGQKASAGEADANRLESPTDLPKPSLVAVLKRARVEFRNDNLTTLAAALTYYAVLAAVPGLVVLFTALGLVREKRHQSGGSPGERGRSWIKRPLRADAAFPGSVTQDRGPGSPPSSDWSSPYGQRPATSTVFAKPRTSSTGSARGAQSGRPSHYA